MTTLPTVKMIGVYYETRIIMQIVFLVLIFKYYPFRIMLKEQKLGNLPSKEI